MGLFVLLRLSFQLLCKIVFLQLAVGTKSFVPKHILLVVVVHTSKAGALPALARERLNVWGYTAAAHSVGFVRF